MLIMAVLDTAIPGPAKEDARVERGHDEKMVVPPNAIVPYAIATWAEDSGSSSPKQRW